eukprot:293906_1
MSSCVKCAGYCSVFILLLAVLPPLYFRYGDRREFNFNTTADIAANNVDLTGQVIIVTGSNTGIGKPTAKILLSHGATVIMACRNEQKAANARTDIITELSLNNFKNASKHELQSRLDTIQLNLASLQSIKSFSDAFQSKYDQLNQLILNAGIMALPEFRTTEDGIEKQFGVNHIGHAYLARLVTPLLIRSAANSNNISRVIVVSSHGHNFAPTPIHTWLINDSMVQDPREYGAWSAYGFSKACNVLFAMEYTKRYAKDNVYAVSVHPGMVETELGRHMVETRLFAILQFLRPVLFMLKNPSQGAATTVRTATISDEQFKENGGNFFDDCNVANQWIRKDLLERNVDENGKSPQMLLWEMTEKILNTKSH